MARGGVRRGAGRKANTDFLEALDIGSECQMRFAAVHQAAIEQAISARHSKSDYSEQIAAVQSIPVAERVGWLQSIEFENHMENIEFSRREMQGIDADDETAADRLVTYRATRPYGVRAQIIADVSTWASEKYTRKISGRTVQSAWEQYRQFLLVMDSQT